MKNGEPRPLTMFAWLRWDAVERLLPQSATRVLDIGTGAGTVGSFLANRYEYVGVEPDPTSFEQARQRIGTRGTVLNSSYEGLEPKQDFDLVVALEVLEHLEDDDRALRSWTQHLRPGGRILVSVPLHRRRFGAEDKRVGHFRRYDVQDVEELFDQANLEKPTCIVHGSPLGNLRETIQNVVYTVRPTKDSLDERTAESARLLEPPPWAAFATRAVAFPFRYVQRPLGSWGIGTGVVALGRLRADERAAQETR